MRAYTAHARTILMKAKGIFSQMNSEQYIFYKNYCRIAF